MYFLKLKKLDISYNNLSDDGIDAIIQSMAQFGSPIEELNLSGNKISDGQIKILADHIKHKMKSLSNVILDDCDGPTDEARATLKLAQNKAVAFQGNAKLNRMYKKAKKIDEAELSEGN